MVISAQFGYGRRVSYFPCINNMNVMFYSFCIRFSLKDITAFYYAEKLLHELMRIYLEKNCPIPIGHEYKKSDPKRVAI